MRRRRRRKKGKGKKGDCMFKDHDGFITYAGSMRNMKSMTCYTFAMEIYGASCSISLGILYILNSAVCMYR
jgi:hypothetical protein